MGGGEAPSRVDGEGSGSENEGDGVVMSEALDGGSVAGETKKAVADGDDGSMNLYQLSISCSNFSTITRARSLSFGVRMSMNSSTQSRTVGVTSSLNLLQRSLNAQ